MRRWVLVAAMVAIAGCDLSFPVVGQIGRDAAQGETVASLDGKGTFYALTTGGLRCDGTYDALATSATITAPVRCSDGRTATLIITRSPDRLSGTAIGRLSDGTEARFVFGNLAFSQATGAGGAQTLPAN